MSKRVLLICYYFPPLGLGGVGRVLNLFKRLPSCGWECDVLTVKPVLYRAYEPELLDGLETSRIFRSGSRDPQRLLYLMGVRKIKPATISRGRRISEKFFPDSKAGWVRPAVRLGDKLCRRRGYDVIMSTSPPISSHLIGIELSHRHDIPWVADFRDFWTIYKAEDVFDSETRISHARQLLQDIKSHAAAITTVNRSIAEYLGAGETITNGYDPDHARQWRARPDLQKFTVGLLGHQHDTRELEPLLDLLEGLRDRDPGVLEGLRLLQVGQIDADWFGGLLQERGLTLQTDLRGRQKRDDTIRILSEAHLFYYGVSEREGPGFLPGRTFELIASGRPIFACVRPDSEVARVLAPLDNACCFDANSLDRAVDALMSQITAFVRGEYHYEPLSEYAVRFSADALAERFAQLMDRLV